MAKDLRLYVEMVAALRHGQRGGQRGVGGVAGRRCAMPGTDFTEIWKHISKKGRGGPRTLVLLV